MVRRTLKGKARRRLWGRRGMARIGAFALVFMVWVVVPAISSGSAPTPEVSNVAPEALGEAAKGQRSSRPGAGRAMAGRAGDVKDTHGRLQNIYARLGIQRATEAPKARENQGCSCQPRDKGKSGSRTSRPSFRAPALPPILGWILIGIVVLGMVVPLVLALRSGIKDATPSAAADPEGEEDGATLVDASSPWRVSLDRCRRLVAEGRLGEAYGALHRLTLVALQHEGHLNLEATITNWQYVSRLLSKPSLRELLSAVTIAAERSVFGHQPPGPGRYRELEKMLISRIEGVS